jgi:elongation factor 1-gamma
MIVLKATFGWGVVDSDVYNSAVKDLKDSIKVLNTHLQGKDYLVGNHLTVADLVVACSLILPFQTALDGGFRKAMQNVTNLVDKIVKLPEVVKRLGNVKFAHKVIKAQVAPKKEEAKKEVKKAAAHAEDGDEEEKPVKKEANPLDTLPPSPFDLYSFKTFFVNSKDKRGEGMKFFFENYDRAGYCVYFIHYEKYEGEGTVLYQTANGMNGFL